MGPENIPDPVEERVDAYRTLVADRRILVVLDDAADAAQVRPLLPSGPGSVVLVTSRPQLVGLESARLVDLDVLPVADGVALLAAVAGPDRVAAQPDAAVAIAAACGGLPLALRIAGARLAARPSWSLRRLADRLADEHRRLDELAAGDLAVRASVELSHRLLPEPSRRVFRRLGVLAAPDLPGWTAAAVLDVPLPAAERALGPLVEAHLIEEAGEDQAGQLRYRFHDLLRVYARERAAVEDTPADLRAAVDRALGGWLALAETSAPGLPMPTLGAVSGPAPRWPAAGPPPVPAADALAWFDAERVALVAAIAQAADSGRAGLAWDLAGLLTGYFTTRWHLDDWERTHELALRAAVRAGDLRGQAYMLRGLGQLTIERDDFDTALGRFTGALALSERHPELPEDPYARIGVGYVHQLVGRPEEALRCFTQALALARSSGAGVAVAYAQWNLGLTYRSLGRYAEAGASLREAADGFAAGGQPQMHALTVRSIGLLHQSEGELEQAAAAFRTALVLLDAVGDDVGRAVVLQGLGELDPDPARGEELLTEGIRIAREIGNRFGEARGLWSRGGLHLAAGRLGAAESDLEAALALWLPMRSPLWEARTLDRLGAVRAGQGRRTEARESWRAALALFERLGAPEREALADRLRTV